MSIRGQHQNNNNTDRQSRTIETSIKTVKRMNKKYRIQSFVFIIHNNSIHQNTVDILHHTKPLSSLV